MRVNNSFLATNPTQHKMSPYLLASKCFFCLEPILRNQWSFVNEMNTCNEAKCMGKIGIMTKVLTRLLNQLFNRWKHEYFFEKMYYIISLIKRTCFQKTFSYPSDLIIKLIIKTSRIWLKISLLAFFVTSYSYIYLWQKN